MTVFYGFNFSGSTRRKTGIFPMNAQKYTFHTECSPGTPYPSLNFVFLGKL